MHLHRYHNEAAKCKLKLQEAVKKWRTGKLHGLEECSLVHWYLALVG